MTNFNTTDVVKFTLALSSDQDKYAYLKMVHGEISPEQFAELSKALSAKGFNISQKKLAESPAITEEKLKEVIPEIVVEELKNPTFVELTEEEQKEAQAFLKALEEKSSSSTNSSRGFGGEELILSAKWLGAASAALTAGGVALMRDDLSLGALAGSAVGVVGGYFTADYIDTKLTGKSGFVRYLAALSAGSACGAAGQFLGSLTQEKLFSDKEEGVDININIQSPGESQALDQLMAVDWY